MVCSQITNASNVYIYVYVCVCLYQDGAISSLNDKLLKLVDQFIYFSSSISSTENNVNVHMVNSLMTIWKSDLSDKIT